MMAEPENEIKIKLRLVGVSQKAVAVRLGVPYSTLSSWLGGFSTLPDDRRQDIEKMIAEKYSQEMETDCERILSQMAGR
jgi:DNA-binding transcriptional regulator YdaS (Cro superfamily)